MLRLVTTGLCWALVVVQLIGTMLWSRHVLDLASLTRDFGTYYQPWYLIAHGQLLPHNTLQGGYLFMRNDGELIVYVLAPLYWLFPNHELGFLWLQDLAAAGVSATCLAIVVEALPWRVEAARREQAVAAIARVLVVVLVVANPFVYWTASFDVHMEVYGACFGLLALRAALRGRAALRAPAELAGRAALRGRRGIVLWALLTALCGTASLIFLVGVGITATIVRAWRRRDTLRPAAWSVMAPRDPSPPVGDALPVGEAPDPGGRRQRGARWRGRVPPWPVLRSAGWPLGLSAVAIVWLVVLAAAHATVGSPANGYAYLTGQRGGGQASMLAVALGLLERPGSAYSVIASHRWNLWANTSPDGLVGLLGPAFFLAAPTLLANNLLKTDIFSYPGFQSFAVYGAVALGSVGLVAVLLRRRISVVLGAVLVVAMLANSWGWFDTWIHTTGPEWVRLTPPSAAVVESVAAEVGSSDEVVASQGFVGLFAGRDDVYSLSGPQVVPVASRTVWFVLAVAVGQETATFNETLEAIDTVDHLPGVQTLEVDDDGIWVYRWHPSGWIRRLDLGEPGDAYPIWMDPGKAGLAVTSGPASGWMVESFGKTGYLFDGDTFQLPPGRYVATLLVRCEGPVIPEVWDDDNGKLLAGIIKGVTAPRGEVVRMDFTVRAPTKPLPEPSSGSGLFRDQPIPTTPDATVEVRVWTPFTTLSQAWWAAVSPAPASSPHRSAHRGRHDPRA
jgi:hypothetical protein